jgi:indolepyruvate ferredoxin oxidoreductase beta subunit
MVETNIVLAGVGGQGTLLAAEIIGTAAVEEGLNVRVSEIHGMAQRGGAVTSDVRIGENVLAPTVTDMNADVLLSFEPLETLRNLRYVSQRTLVIVSDETIPPTELAATNRPYPSLQEIEAKIVRFAEHVTTVPSARLAKKAGNPLTKNTVMIGALAATGTLPLRKESILKAIKALVPPKHVESNIKAFKMGFEYMKRQSQK